VGLDPLVALDRAVEEFRRHLLAVGESDWTAATPCVEWDVHFLVAHAVGGNRFASMVLDGQSAAEALAVVMGTSQLGASPLADFDDSAAAQRERFGRPGALEAGVSHPLGEISGRRFLGMRVFDVAVHGWDLATALGRAVMFDDDLVAHVLDTVSSEAPGFGIEPRGDVGPDAGPLERLLDLAGRRAGDAPS
jgi:uncharacterized protein (TIGR03086 family)